MKRCPCEFCADGKPCGCLGSMEPAPGLRTVEHGDAECVATWLDGSGPPEIMRAAPRCERCERVLPMVKERGGTLCDGCPHGGFSLNSSNEVEAA